MGDPALGDFLRSRRARIGPADLGLPLGTARRATPGLRRGEVASLAGISVEYYTRLEQGRDTHPTPSVLDAIARALRLDPAERDHLHGLVPGQHRLGTGVRQPSPGLVQLLAALRPLPALVLDEVSTVLDANPEGLALFTGLADWAAPERNLTRYHFTHPQSRETMQPWAVVAAACVADLRTISARSSDPAVPALVDELRAASPAFADLWQRHDIGRNVGGPRRFGDLNLVSEILTARDGLQLLVFQPAG